MLRSFQEIYEANYDMYGRTKTRDYDACFLYGLEWVIKIDSKGYVVPAFRWPYYNSRKE